MSACPAGRWTYLHRTALRIGAVALAAPIFVFLSEPTVLAVIVIVAVLLILLGLIELIGGQAADRTAEGWSGGALTPSRHDAEADT